MARLSLVGENKERHIMVDLVSFDLTLAWPIYDQNLDYINIKLFGHRKVLTATSNISFLRLGVRTIPERKKKVIVFW